MPRLPVNKRIATASARERLRLTGEIEWDAINSGLFLGYRKTDKGGTWWARQYRKVRGRGRYEKERLGLSDDRIEANGHDVLSYAQARDKAIDWSRKNLPADSRNYTVNRAADNYVAWFKLHKQSFSETVQAIDAHIRPALGEELISDLTTSKIRKWFHEQAETPKRLRRRKGESEIRYAEFSEDPEERAEELRQRKSTANRLLTILKAILNFTHREDKIGNPAEWIAVTPFVNVDSARVTYFEPKECKKLLAACDEDFQGIVQATLFCGFRYGEVASLLVSDFDPIAKTIRVAKGKTGKRTIHISDEAVLFFSSKVRGKVKHDRIFLRIDGSPWKKSDQRRPLKKALRLAGLWNEEDPKRNEYNFYSLRHTYGTLLSRAGVPIKYIAEQMGNSVAICAKYYAHSSPDDISRMINERLPSFAA